MTVFVMYMNSTVYHYYRMYDVEQVVMTVFVMYMNITVYHYYSMYDVEQVAMTVFVMFSPSKTLRVQYSMK